MSALTKQPLVISDEKVWMEGRALEQLSRVAERPGCRRAVGMPDLHPGRGIPLGAVFLFDAIHPQLIGGDQGCGVRLVPVLKARVRGDALFRRVKHYSEAPILPDVDRQALQRLAWHKGPRGLAELDGVPEALKEMLATEASSEGLVAPLPLDGEWGEALGSIGGGNHFAELSQVSKGAERSLGLRSGSWAVLVHSGSRALGAAIARRWQGKILEQPEEQSAYMAELQGALNYARCNRALISWRLLEALGAARASRIGPALDIVHNNLSVHPEGWLHRKGAAPAEAGQLTLVLGSRGSPSWLMRGLGEAKALSSVAHGAGRRMSRGEALEKLRHKYRRKDLRAEAKRLLCSDRKQLWMEHPKAYKPIEPIIRALESEGCAQRILALEPQITVKG